MKWSARTRTYLGLIALVWVAFALRVYRLDAQSLWSDEGLSVYRARLTLSENLSNVIVVPPNVHTQDTNPPLYFLLLSAVRAVAGESEYALRFLSAAAGTLLVTLMWAAGRRWVSAAAGWWAAILTALSPFMVWYSQELRMYALETLLSVASIYWLRRALDRSATDRRAPWLIWAALAAAMAYTHFTAFFVLAFEGLLIALNLLRVRRRVVVLALLALLVVAAPIGLYAVSRAQESLSSAEGFRPLSSIAEEVLDTVLVGRSNAVFQPWWAIVPGVIALVAGAVVIARQPRSRGWLIGYALIPFGLFYAAALLRPIYAGPRHVIWIAPALYVIAAAGLAGLWARARLIGAGVGVAMLVLMGVWLRVQYFDPAYIKGDMRSAAQTIGARAAADDIVIVHDAISSFVFDYYYDGVAPWRIIPTYPSREVEPALAEFQATAQAARRVWFVTEPAPLSDFPPKVLDEWARGHLLRLDYATYPSIWLGSAYQLYTAHFPVFDTLPADARVREEAWPADALRLAGVSAIEQTDEAVRLSIYWRLSAPGQRNLATTITLIDATGAPCAVSSSTIFDNWSVRDWPVDKYIRQDVMLKSDTPLAPGDYRALLTLAERKSGEVLLPADGATSIDLGAITIAP
ncbi:hypothetical protein MYXO_01139 [Myxococcaceae bacterium]|nr:hypothetical protein MYXO_01139 [Myxococcaceae bacterium]